jgi:hypothetical protein
MTSTRDLVGDLGPLSDCASRTKKLDDMMMNGFFATTTQIKDERCVRMKSEMTEKQYTKMIREMEERKYAKNNEEVFARKYE